MEKKKGVLKMTAVYLSTKPVTKVMKLSDFDLPLTRKIEGYHSVLYWHQNANKAAAVLTTHAVKNNLNVLTATVLYDLGAPLPTGVVGSENGIPMEETRFLNMSRLASSLVKDVAEMYKDIYREHGPRMSEEGLKDLHAWTRPHEFMPEFCNIGVPKLFEKFDIDVLVHPVRFTMTKPNDSVYVGTYKIDPKKIISVEPNIWETKGPVPDEILVE